MTVAILQQQLMDETADLIKTENSPPTDNQPSIYTLSHHAFKSNILQESDPKTNITSYKRSPQQQQQQQQVPMSEETTLTHSHNHNDSRPSTPTSSSAAAAAPPPPQATTKSATAVSPKSSDDGGINELAYAELVEMRNGTLNHSSSNTNGNGSSTTHSQQHQFFPSACRSLLLELEGNQKCLDCGMNRPEWAAVSYGALVCIKCSGHHRSLGVQTSLVRHITMDHWTFPQVIKMLEGGNAQLQSFFERHALTQSAFVQKQQEKEEEEEEALAATTLLPLSSPSNNTTTTGTFSSSTFSSTSPPRTRNNGSSNSNNSNHSNSNATSSASSVLTTDNLQVMRYKTKAALFYREQLDHHVQQLLQNESPYRGRKDRKVKRRPLGTHRSTVS